MPVDQIPEPQVAEVEVPVFKEVTVVEEVEVVEGISVVEVPAVTTAPGVEVPEPPVPVVLAGVLLDSVVQTATTAPGVEVPEDLRVLRWIRPLVVFCRLIHPPTCPLLQLLMSS